MFPGTTLNYVPRNNFLILSISSADYSPCRGIGVKTVPVYSKNYPSPVS